MRRSTGKLREDASLKKTRLEMRHERNIAVESYYSSEWRVLSDRPTIKKLIYTEKMEAKGRADEIENWHGRTTVLNASFLYAVFCSPRYLLAELYHFKDVPRNKFISSLLRVSSDPPRRSLSSYQVVCAARVKLYPIYYVSAGTLYFTRPRASSYAFLPLPSRPAPDFLRFPFVSV